MLLALLAPLAACEGPDPQVPQNAGGGSDAWRVLVDFDNFPHPPNLEADIVAEHVIKHVVKEPFAHKKEDCASAGAKVVARATGGFTGAFTKKGSAEHAYLVHTHACEGDEHEKHHLVVLQQADSAVLVDQEVPERMIAEVQDLDQDGDNEILLIGAHKEGETVIFTARMVDTEDAHFDTLFDFKEIGRSTCPDGQAESPLIKYRIKGTQLEYAAEKRNRPCKGHHAEHKDAEHKEDGEHKEGNEHKEDSEHKD
jgi:hypothetical protein